jgi:uncharacterized protein DUF6527
MAKKLLNWLADFFSKKYKYKFINDVPNKLKPDIIYFIGHEGYYWQAIMICPCGCKKNLQMNLISDHSPYWKYKIEKKNLITLSPSIRRVVGCKSHFFIVKGKLLWA